MIVDKVWKLTNTVRIRLDPRSSHAQRQSIFPDIFFWKFFFNPQKTIESVRAKMGKSDEKTKTGEGGKGAGLSRMMRVENL